MIYLMNELVDWHGHQGMQTSHISGFRMCLLCVCGEGGGVIREFKSVLRRAAWRGFRKLSASCWSLGQFSATRPGLE